MTRSSHPRTPQPASRHLLVMGTVIACALLPGPADALPWTELELQAKKLFLKARVSIRAEIVDAENALAKLREFDGLKSRPPDANRPVVVVSTETTFLERTSEITALLQLPELQGLQRHLLETGGRNRFKTYRFGETSVISARGEPSDKAEEPLGPEGWTRRSQQEIALTGSQRGATDPIALLVAATTLPMDELRQGVSFAVFSGNEVQTVELVATGAEQQSVDYAIRGAHPVITPRVLHVIEIRADGTSEEEFEMLGLEGNLIVRVDSEHRVPVEIEGKMPVLGTVVISLRQATLSDAWQPRDD